MAGTLQRFWNILRGKTDRLLDTLEKPEEQLFVFVSELNSQIQDLQRSVASAIADEKRLQKQVETVGGRAEEWEARAIMALEEGNEDLARTALLEQEQCHAESATLAESWERQKQATTRLKESLVGAKRRMEDARRRYNLLLAQYKSAQTQQKIQATLSANAADSPMQMMEALEEKIRRVEAKAEAQLELGDGMGNADVEAQFARIDRKRKGDEAVARLQSKVDERRALGQGSEPAPTPDDRIAELKKSLDS